MSSSSTAASFSASRRNWGILDCTLRDGGYYTNWDFPNELVHRYVTALVHSGVRHFELGYRAPMSKSAYRGEYYHVRHSLAKQIREWADAALESAGAGGAAGNNGGADAANGASVGGSNGGSSSSSNTATTATTTTTNIITTTPSSTTTTTTITTNSPSTTAPSTTTTTTPTVSLALMLNVKEVTPEQIPQLLGDCVGIIDTVRLASEPAKLASALALAAAISALGFRVALNMMYLSRNLQAETYEPLQAAVETAVRAGHVHLVNLVDSYGSVLPSQMRAVFRSWRRRFPDILVGFHGHDNLSLAFANALVALEEGADLLDATMTGMGRGAGNLRTELVLAYQRGTLEFEWGAVTELERQFDDMKRQYRWGTSLPYMMSGSCDLPQALVMDLLGSGRYKPSTIMKLLRGQQKLELTAYKPLGSAASMGIEGSFASASSPSPSQRKVLVVGGGPSVREHIGALQEFARVHNTLIVHSTVRHVETWSRGGAGTASTSGSSATSPSSSSNNALPLVHALVLPCQKSLFDVVNNAQAAAEVSRFFDFFVVAAPPRLPVEFRPEIATKVFQVEPFDGTAATAAATTTALPADAGATPTPLSRDAMAILAHSSPLGLTLGALHALLGADVGTVYFCGFDGFRAPTAADQEVMRETVALLSAYKKMRAGGGGGGGVELISLTPSVHCGSNGPLLQGSVYGMLPTGLPHATSAPSAARLATKTESNSAAAVPTAMTTGDGGLASSTLNPAPVADAALAAAK